MDRLGGPNTPLATATYPTSVNANEEVVLGINLSHDMSCAAVVGGEVKVAIAEERLNRVKHCTGLTQFGKIIPYRSIRYCCEWLGIEPADVNLFVANSCRANALEELRAQLIGIPEKRVRDVSHPGHHLAHAYSAFYCSGFDESAVLVTDTNGAFVESPAGGLEKKEHFTSYHGTNDGLRVVQSEDVFPGEVSIGELHCIYSAVLQLTPMDGPYGFDCPLSAGGKLMGLAAYDRNRTPAPQLWQPDESRLSIRLERVIDRLRDLGFVAQEDPAGLGRIFGFQLSHALTFRRRRASLKARRYTALAGEAQRLLEEAILSMARRAHDLTGSRRLCLAGGTLLNVIACTRLLEETPFEQVFVQPAANDAGNAIGAALYGYRELLGGRERPYLRKPYSTFLGRDYPADQTAAAIQRRAGRLTSRNLPTIDEKVEALVSLLAMGEIIGVFQGGSEFGPRALGHRSFIASPAKKSMREKMNRLKKREWYRPVAPVVPKSELARYFAAPFTESPYMTLSSTCRPLTRRLAPAVVHVDGTARPQTVTPEQNPLLHRLLVRFGERAGIPILINTSLNVAGEPIVETPDDALNTFEWAEDVSHFLVGDFLLEKTP
jgi:carbamoyltransferase